MESRRRGEFGDSCEGLEQGGNGILTNECFESCYCRNRDDFPQNFDKRSPSFVDFNIAYLQCRDFAFQRCMANTYVIASKVDHLYFEHQGMIPTITATPEVSTSLHVRCQRRKGERRNPTPSRHSWPVILQINDQWKKELRI
jgi:hypothetical protein